MSDKWLCPHGKYRSEHVCDQHRDHDRQQAAKPPGTVLVEFLLARIADDEWIVKHGPQNPGSEDDWQLLYDHCVMTISMEPERAHQECRAKRQIVELFDDSAHPDLHVDAWTVMKDVIRSLALPYRWHPDYRDEWLT